MALVKVAIVVLLIGLPWAGLAQADADDEAPSIPSGVSPTSEPAYPPFHGLTPLDSHEGLLFSTFVGGSDRESAGSCDVDPLGNMHVMGTTMSVDLPTTTGAFCETTHHKKGELNYYLAKYNADASRVLYCTYLEWHGRSMFWASDMAYAGGDSVWITGFTNATDLPVTLDAYSKNLHGTFGFSDSFLLRLNTSDPRIEYCTYIGGSRQDYARRIAPISSDVVVLAGMTMSSDFPTTEGAYCRTLAGPADTFLLRLSTKSRNLVYSTLIGGPEFEDVSGLAVDAQENPYLLIGTDRSGFPTTDDAYSDRPIGDDDVVVCRLNANGSRLESSTYFGGSEHDSPNDLAVDQDMSVWISGWTNSTDLPTTDDAFQSEFGGDQSDGFVVQISANGTDVPYCTYFGSANYEALSSIAMTGPGRFLITGHFNGTDYSFPSGSIQSRPPGNEDVFLVWFDASAGRMLNGTYLGGSDNEYSMYLSDNVADGVCYVSGSTSSKLFLTTEGAHQTSLKGPSDGFLAAIRLTETPWELPSAPLNLTAIPMDQAVLLTWKPPAYDSGWTIRHYRVFMGLTTGYEPFFKEVVGDTGLLVTGLVNGLVWSFRVSAVTWVGEGPSTGSRQALPFGPPGPPLDLVGESGLGEVRLTWSPPIDDGSSPVLGYHVLRGMVVWDLSVHATLGDITNFTDTGLEPGVLFHYSVRAFNLAGNGSLSKTISAYQLDLPSAPSLLKAFPGDGTVRLTWRHPETDGGRPIDGYRLFRAITGSPLEELQVLGDVQEYSDRNLTNGVTYDYALRAFTSVGDGAMSVTVIATPEGRPTAPLDLVAVRLDRVVGLSWMEPSNDGGRPILGYHVYRGTPDTEPILLLEIGTVTTCVDNGIELGRAYIYRVCAINTHGTGPFTTDVSIVLVDPPGRPTNIQAVASDRTVVLRWEAPVDDGGASVASYLILRGPSEDVTDWSVEVPPTALNYGDEGLVNGVTYFYRVVAINGVGEGLASPAVSATPRGLPGPPLNVTVGRGDANVTLSWEHPVDDGGAAITGYWVLRGDSPDLMMIIARLGLVTTYTDEGLSNGRTYHYSVAAVNEVGNGTLSGTVDAVPAGVPGKPLKVMASVKGRTVTLSWDAPSSDGGSPILRFSVLRGLSADGLSSIGEVSDGYDFTDRGVERGRNYLYAVIAINGVGQGLPTQVVVEVPRAAGSPGPTIIVTVLAIAIVCCMYRTTSWSRGSRRGPAV